MQWQWINTFDLHLPLQFPSVVIWRVRKHCLKLGHNPTMRRLEDRIIICGIFSSFYRQTIELSYPLFFSITLYLGRDAITSILCVKSLIWIVPKNLMRIPNIPKPLKHTGWWCKATYHPDQPVDPKCSGCGYHGWF